MVEASNDARTSAATHDVLVVDDDRAIRELVAEILHSEGYRVLAAGDGGSALARLRGGARPRLILLDLMMPGMSGWQLHAELRKDPELAAIPVVVISGAGDASRAATALGVSGCLVKPFDLDTLLETAARYAHR